MVGLEPTIDPPACSGGREEVNPRAKPEDNVENPEREAA
jgi:hypothetical protein